MQYLKELSPGTIRPHLLDAIRLAAEAEVKTYGQSRQADVSRNAETKRLAALLVEKYAEGMAKALYIVGIDNSVMEIADAMVREIDPEFDAHKAERWRARPADVALKQAAP